MLQMSIYPVLHNALYAISRYRGMEGASRAACENEARFLTPRSPKRLTNPNVVLKQLGISSPIERYRFRSFTRSYKQVGQCRLGFGLRETWHGGKRRKTIPGNGCGRREQARNEWNGDKVKKRSRTALHGLLIGLIMSKITYALPAFAGHLTADDRNRINAITKGPSPRCHPHCVRHCRNHQQIWS